MFVTVHKMGQTGNEAIQSVTCMTLAFSFTEV